MTTPTEQFRRLADLARLGSYGLPATIEVMIATSVVVAVTAASFSAWWQPEARLAALLTPVLCFVVAAAPEYRFGQFAIAPTLIIVVATSAHRLVPRPWGHRRVGSVVAGVIACTLVGLALTAVHDVVPRSSDLDRLRAFAAGPRPRCVWFETASEAVAADALTAPLARGCPVPVDRLADFRAQNPTPRLRDALHEARHSGPFQLRLAAELRAADAAVIATDDDTGILGDGTQEAIPRSFRRVREYEIRTH